MFRAFFNALFARPQPLRLGAGTAFGVCFRHSPLPVLPAHPAEKRSLTARKITNNLLSSIRFIVGFDVVLPPLHEEKYNREIVSMKPVQSVVSSLAAFLFLLCSVVPSTAQEVSSQDLKPALEQLMRENPDLFLNFLRENSVTLLDIVQQGSEKRRMANMEAQWAEDAKEPKKVATADRPRVGQENAKVQIVAFSDFTCQFCLKAEKTVEDILKKYDGRVSFVFKNMPLERDGLGGLASTYFIAISMINEEQAWKFYKAMFHDQDKLLLDGEKFLRATATEIGVDMKKMDSLRRGKKVAAILDEDIKDADNLKLEGTPCFLVNNLVIRGDVPDEIFSRAVEIELNPKK